MSYSYERFETQRRQGYGASGRRTTLGYWVPLALTVTVATIGLAAWIWKERGDDDEEYDRDRKDTRPPPPDYGDVRPGHTTYAPGAQPPPQAPQGDDPGMMARMSGALRRTPSPQQFFDEASRRVVAGVAAAGAAVGGALTSIREEEKGDYEDHSRWSEEAVARARLGTAPAAGGPGARGPPIASPTTQGQSARKPNDKRKNVAIVVSADTGNHGPGHGDETYLQEHASILSHLPEHIDGGARVFIMIYAPDLKQHPLSSNTQASRAPGSITSSYSNIGHEDLHTPAEESELPLTNIDPQPMSNSPDMFNPLYAQARALVEKETMIMPFTTPKGYVQLLRHIAPEVVYVQATLSGPGGDTVKDISGWVGQVVLVVGDDSGHGGLVDSEDERGTAGEARDRWWQNDSKIGLGKGIEVVEGLRVGEDWRRRVRGHD